MWKLVGEIVPIWWTVLGMEPQRLLIMPSIGEATDRWGTADLASVLGTWFAAWCTRFRDATLCRCLLYTSPSPRDA